MGDVNKQGKLLGHIGTVKAENISPSAVFVVLWLFMEKVLKGLWRENYSRDCSEQEACTLRFHRHLGGPAAALCPPPALLLSPRPSLGQVEHLCGLPSPSPASDFGYLP